MWNFMKRSLCAILVFQLLSINAIYAREIKAGTGIYLEPNEEVTSKKIKKGAKVDMFVSRDVMDGNNVFIPRGATAYLTAKEVKKATFFGIGGKMTLSGGQVFDINDQPHSIKYYNKYEGEDREWATALGIVGCVFWFLLPFAFVKGEEAELHAGQEVVTTLGENVEL